MHRMSIKKQNTFMFEDAYYGVALNLEPANASQRHMTYIVHIVDHR